jgi:hypothetical protein
MDLKCGNKLEQVRIVRLRQLQVDPLSVQTDHHTGRSYDSAIIRNIMHEYKCIRTNEDVIANIDGSQDSRTCTDKYSITYSRMTLCFVLAGSPKRYVVKQHTPITDLGSLADYNSHAVIDEQPLADFRARVNLDTGEKTTDLGYHARNQRYAKIPKEVSETVHPYSLKACVEEHLQIACGRVISINRPDIFEESIDDACQRGLPLKQLIEELFAVFLDLVIDVFLDR